MFKNYILFSAGDSEIFFVLAVQSSNFLPEVSQKSSFTLNGEVYVSLPLTPCSPPSDLTKEMETIHPKMGNDHSEERRPEAERTEDCEVKLFQNNTHYDCVFMDPSYKSCPGLGRGY